MYSNDLVRVICVARSCYCISVSDKAVIGLDFEITALDEFGVVVYTLNTVLLPRNSTF